MYVIGFAKQFYTLWDVDKEVIDCGNHKIEISHNHFIKNISFNKDKAAATYPGISIDETLHGHTSSFETKKILWTNIDTFRFGKYSGQNINECTDIDYIYWYYNNCEDEQKVFVEYVLKSHGYKLINGFMHNPLEVEQYEKSVAKNNEICDKISRSEELSFVPTSNIDSDGMYTDYDSNVTYVFEQIQQKAYNGYSYYLPVLNGKAKRIKNKKVIITKYNTEKFDDGLLLIKIIDFKIEK